MVYPSLAGSSSVARHEVVVLLLPRGHVSWYLPCEYFITLLFKRVLCLSLHLKFVVFRIVFLVLVENLGVVRKILFVWSPGLAHFTRGVVGILHIKISRGDVVVVNPMLDILEVFVGRWHTNFPEFVDHLILYVLSAVLDVLVLRVNDFTERLFSLFTVDLRELLHFHLVFSHKMFFLLRKIAEVLGWRSGKYLTGGDSHILRNVSSS